MNHFHKLAIGSMLVVALAAPALPSATGKDEQGQHATKIAPIIERQMKSLTESLDLTPDQQQRITPILQELHDAAMKVMKDESLSHDARMGRAHPLFYKADQQIRQILTEEQQKKLDKFEQEPHPEMHADLMN